MNFYFWDQFAQIEITQSFVHLQRVYTLDWTSVTVCSTFNFQLESRYAWLTDVYLNNSIKTLFFKMAHPKKPSGIEKKYKLNKREILLLWSFGVWALLLIFEVQFKLMLRVIARLYIDRYKGFITWETRTDMSLKNQLIQF